MAYSYNPWSKAGIARLYVNEGDRKLGYLDLGTLKKMPLKGAEKDLDRALAELVKTAATEPHLPPLYEEIARATAAPVPSLPWTDLASTPPGGRIQAKADARSYADGVIGEQRTAGALHPLLSRGWKVLHAIPLSPIKDVDHLLIGPGGVVIVNTKNVTYAVQATFDNSVFVDRRRQNWTESLTRDAQLVAERLSAAVRVDLMVTPLVAIWSIMEVRSDSLMVIPGSDLVSTVDELRPVFPPEMVDAVYTVARRSDTWDIYH